MSSLFVDVSHRITFSLAWWLLRPPPNPSMKSPSRFRFFEFFCIDLKFVNWISLIIIKNFVLIMRFEIRFDTVHFLSFSLLLYRFGSILIFVCLCRVSKLRCNWKSRFGLSFFFPGFYWGRNKMSRSHNSLRRHIGAINVKTNSFISKS